MKTWVSLLVFLFLAGPAFAQQPGVLASGPPFGSFDTPANAVFDLTGAVAITGWALDDTGVTAVDIQRDAHPSDPSGAVVNGRVFVGRATFVTGARSDIAAAYAAYPNATRAGWGYLMLTRGLIWDGQGAFRLYAIATDTRGNTTTLGSKLISVTNSTAVKPFGNIDTPTQGAMVSGSFVNFGWVLTPNAGATVPAGNARVAIDNVYLPQSSECLTSRADITQGFPLFNTSQAIRCFRIDTTKYADGLHTIGWVVTDSAGQADGLGSRFFTIANTAFGPGQYLVGNEIQAGRYYAAPASGCYWKRLSGLGGTTKDIIANDFLGSGLNQAVIDIRASDVAFSTESECGTWTAAPRGGLQTTIPPGTWLVNTQLAPGTYRAVAASSCYWKRLRNFDGGFVPSSPMISSRPLASSSSLSRPMMSASTPTASAAHGRACRRSPRRRQLKNSRWNSRHG